MTEPGAEEAYDAFFKASWGRLQGQAFVLTGSMDQAQDLTQEAMLRAWAHWDRISTFESAEGWTRRVLHNLCIGSWRQAQVRKISGQRPQSSTGPGEPSTTGAMAEDHMVLAGALRQLPGDQARALLLHDGLGLTVADTAREIGVPEGTVKSWLSRARKIVAAQLGDQLETTHEGAES